MRASDALARSVVNSWKCVSRSRPSAVKSGHGPSKTSRPSLMNSTRLAIASTSCRMCVESKIVLVSPRRADRVAHFANLIRDRSRRSARRESTRRARAAAPGPCRRAADSLSTTCRSPCRSRCPGRTGRRPRRSARRLRCGRHAAGVGEELQQAARRHVGIQRAVFRQVAQPGRAGQPIGRHVVAGDPGRCRCDGAR